KGHFADQMIGRIFRARQYKHLTNPNALTGEFTEHLAGAVFVFGDESFWSTKAAADRLKPLITEDTIELHPKFFPRYSEPSSLHLMIASNHAEDALFIERDDRRFAVFELDESAKNDQSYFAVLREELEHGGRAAMLNELGSVSIDDDLLRMPPDSLAK